MNQKELKNLLEENLRILNNMSIEEQTLYRKWIDIQYIKWIPKNKNKILQVKKDIWKPSLFCSYKDIKPKLIYVNNNNRNFIWNILRHFTCSATWNGTVGRNIRCIVIDENTNKYLGVICLSSDFTDVGGRNDVIGWNRDHQLKQGRLNYTMNGSAIVPTQPLGYNFLGGKLLSLLCISDEVEKIFNEKYKEKLAGITTTSLYGGFSQYSGLKYWKKCKSSEGKIELDFTTDKKHKMKEFWIEHYPEEYNELKQKSHFSRSFPRYVRSKLNITKYYSDYKRGVYWCPLYKNTNEFLRMEHDTLKEKKFDNSFNSLVELWKEKYASKRNKLITNTLFYDDILTDDWSHFKSKYLKEIGR